MDSTSLRRIRRELETGVLSSDAATDRLAEIAHLAPVRAVRVDAYRLLGDVAGRAFDAPWAIAEKAAFRLLDLARHADAVAERAALLRAMGRGFRNVWLLPFVHARLAGDRPEIVAGAIAAAGGLGFAALEEALASRFLAADAPRALRLDALAALGRMGATSAAERILPFVQGDAIEAAAALTALTEMRNPVATEAAVQVIDRDPPEAVLVAATRYLAEMGRTEVLPALRRLARADEPELRVAAGLASRALKAELSRDAGERILVALAERDRAVRAALARRLRALPVADVLREAETLLPGDPVGVVQVIGEVRTAEVTRFLLAVAARTDLPVPVRARAVSAVEANEPWEREALVRLIAGQDAATTDEAVRVAAAQTMGAFATLDEVFRHLGPLAGDPSPALRGALLWALQLAAHPVRLEGADRGRCEEAVRRGLADADPFVRRRAAYVAGNLRLEGLAPALVSLAREEEDRADLRIAALTGLGELRSPAALGDLVGLFKRETDAQALTAAARAMGFTLETHPGTPLDLSRIQGKLAHLLAGRDAVVRRAAVKLAGLAGGVIAAPSLLALAADPAPGVREETLTALGRLATSAPPAAPEIEDVLLAAMDEADPALHERAADALLRIGSDRAIARLLRYAVGEDDGASRAQVAARIAPPPAQAAGALVAVTEALAGLHADDPAYEPLVALKVRLLEKKRAADTAGRASVDEAIATLFAAYPRLAAVPGFEALGRSLRTAEALYGTSTIIQDADCSPPIILWMKCLEGYVHAWLAPRLQSLQRERTVLREQVDHVLVAAWPTYRRYLSEHWQDPVDVGGARVEVSLRAATNVLRDLQERGEKRLGSPLSVTEWARMMLLLAVDHPAGVRNLLRIESGGPDRIIRVSHRLQVLAQVRNLVTHRAAATAATVEAFRKAYYATFEELIRLAQ